MLIEVKRTFLIDTDTASDDAVALLMALRADDVHVAGITTVAGNVDVDQATRNALYTVALSGGPPVPVFRGAERPLVRAYENATWFHGEDGLGDQGFSQSALRAEPTPALDAILSLIRDNPGIVLVTLGPLTNIALALQKNPSVARNVSRCIVMGGAPCCEGNVTPAAEYNIWVDPDAARVVMRGGLPVELIGWQLCRGEAMINEIEIEELRKLGAPAATFAVECNRTAIEAIRVQTGEIGISLPDPVAMGIAIDPSLMTDSSSHLVEIETGSELTRGMTVVDRLNAASNRRNHKVWAQAIESRAYAKIAWTMDVPAWKRQLFSALRK